MENTTKLIRLSSRSRFMLGGAIFLGALNALLIPVPFLMAWRILEQLMGHAVQGNLTTLFCYAALAVFARWAFQLSSIALSHFAALHVSTDLRHRLLTHLGDLPLHWHSGQTTGGLKKVFTTDVGQIDGFIAHHIPDAISALVLPLTALSCLTWINWKMGLLLIPLFVLCLALQAGSYAAMGKNNIWKTYNEALENLNAAVVEFVRGMPVIKLFNRGVDSFAKMREAVEAFREIQVLGYRVFAPRWAMFSSLTVMPFTVAAIGGGTLYVTGHASLADVTLFLMLGGVSLSPLTKLSRLAAIAAEAEQSVARIRAVFTAPAEKRGALTASAADAARIEADSLCVRFGDKTILHNVSFAAEPGTTTAVVGASGSGKSTLAAVLAGMEEISGGSVRIGGHALVEFPSPELARLVAPVFQAPHIFTATVSENIALGMPAATPEAITAAAAAARCDDFIKTLPNGYGTRIGDGGETHLSGGQKQRIALARMALRRPPIVILDEATAYADAESEAEIQAALSTLLRGCTVVAVAHRLQTIAGADQILVMDKGTIAERGTHESLLACDGMYAAMWNAHHKARSWSIASAKKDGQRC